MAVQIQTDKRLFNIREYHQMSKAGILSEDERVELIEGEIRRMSPIGSHHVGCVNRLSAILNRLAGAQAIVSVQNPILLGDASEPQPDIALLHARPDFYSDSLATPKDVILLIEVSDTTAHDDRQKKVPLYASWGIPSLWIVDLTAGIVEVYTHPMNDNYVQVEKLEVGQQIDIPGIDGATMSVDYILGRA
ncbi:MAG: Uma2 family endonuclease [Chloroflexia bacterium]